MNNQISENQEQLNNLRPGDSISVSNKQYMSAPELEKIAQTVIEKNGMDLYPANIDYLLVYPNISKYKAANVKKASSEMTHHTGIHYHVEVSGEAWDMLDSKTRETLVYHQLLQIDPVFKAKKQEWKMKLRKPDFKDFYEINDSHGSEWYKTIQATVSSLYDLDPKRESKVTA